MPLGTDYAAQNCPIARSLEIVGERWTLLIVRDLFHGLRRYSDLRKHIGLPPAVLTARLSRLVDEGVIIRVAGRGARDEYELTPKGTKLWPVLSGLIQWGNDNYVAPGSRILITHQQCGSLLDKAGHCVLCGVTPAAEDVVVRRQTSTAADPISHAVSEPHRLLLPLRI